mgnify:CR=1 FL=1
MLALRKGSYLNFWVDLALQNLPQAGEISGAKSIVHVQPAVLTRGHFQLGIGQLGGGREQREHTVEVQIRRQIGLYLCV